MEVFYAGHLCKRGKEILPKATCSKETSFLKMECRAECPATQQILPLEASANMLRGEQEFHFYLPTLQLVQACHFPVNS